jgi:hypothetical protein
MYSKTAIITFFAGFAAAQIHAPVGEPAGNPITRPLNEVCLHLSLCARIAKQTRDPQS